MMITLPANRTQSGQRPLNSPHVATFLGILDLCALGHCGRIFIYESNRDLGVLERVLDGGFLLFRGGA
jgi:hypothetical protein